MYLLGYSLNNLSLMALTLSVGFVVDDAIVMLENIVRYMEMGKPRMEAALLASREIGFTILSMTISLVAVFIPVLFMGGIVGRLLHEFSVTITVAILISGFVSLSFTPMLGSRYLQHDHGGHHGWVYRVLESGFNGMAGMSTTSRCRVVLRHRFDDDAVRLCACSPEPFICSSPCRPASFPARTADLSSASPWPGRTSLSNPWPSISTRSPISCGSDPNVEGTGAFLPRRQSGLRISEI